MINWNAVFELLVYDPERPLLFNSFSFFILFSLFYLLYISLSRQKALRIVYTVCFSLYFYYNSSGFYFLLLILSTLVDFILGHYIYHASHKGWRRWYLFLSILANLGMLAYFKYTNFFIDVYNTITATQLPALSIFLPVGISFFTFQTMSYSIDIYRGQLVPITEKIVDNKSFWNALSEFAFFVSFFPQLVAGPIVRAADFLPQMDLKLSLSREQMGRGFALIISGLFKKAIISDYISINFVDRIFDNPALYSGFENLMAGYGYAIQIYCDFSGYSDMAIGLALLLGFRLPENFRFPYQSRSLQEFWRRWHISLSSWLRDYLYISLGGNRKGKLRTYFNLMITMLLGGLWHGASWVFIFWGALHGFFLAIDRLLAKSLNVKSAAGRSFIVFMLVHAGGLAGVYFLLPAEDPDRLALSYGIILSSLIWIIFYAFTVAMDEVFGFRENETGNSFKKLCSIILTFHFVIFCWIFFRAGALNNPNPPLVTVKAYFTQLLSQFDWTIIGQVLMSYPGVFGLMLLGMILHWLPIPWHQRIQELYTQSPAIAKAFSLAFVVWLVIQTASSDVVPFIYFQF